jgi:O-methyltransferase
MRWKTTVNKVLARALGYELVRSETVQQLRESSGRGRTSDRVTPAKARPAPVPVDSPKPKSKPAAKLPGDYDEAMREIWPLVRDRTMNLDEKIYFLTESVRYLERVGIPGDIVECGVWRGGSMLTVARMLDRLGSHHRDLYLFDTFEGMSEPTDRDVHIWTGKSATDVLSSHDRSTSAPLWNPATLEDVQQGFAEVAYPSERIHYVVGKVEDTIPGSAPDQIALLRLDTDWYESTKHEFEHLYHRLAPGGVLVIDDYGSWQGSKEATDEFIDSTSEPLMLTRVGRGRVAVKPGLDSRV